VSVRRLLSRLRHLVPVAAVRQHLYRREPPPPIVDDLIRTTYHAVVGSYRAGKR